MAGKKYNGTGSDGRSAEDRALDRFAELMIQKIETLQGDWKKPWFTPGMAQPPKNLDGRYYNGMNSILLMFQAEKEGYDIPVWGTFDRIIGLNYHKTKDGKTRLADKDGNELPTVTVNKGEKSMPVMLTTFTVVHKETKEKIRYDDYKQLSEEEKQNYNVYPKLSVFNVFNIAAQTNLKEARPELYDKLVVANTQVRPQQEGETFSFEPIDRMIRDNLYICPIVPTHGDQAYYSISRNIIVVPEKEQFSDGESYYGTTLHEMTHASGKEGVLDRLKPGQTFGSSEYAREELVAELTAAYLASRYGMEKHLKDDSAAYLKSWLGSLKESPDFLKSTLLDVKRASSFIGQRIDKIALDIEQGIDTAQAEGRPKTPKEQVEEKPTMEAIPAKSFPVSEPERSPEKVPLAPELREEHRFHRGR